MVIAQVIILSHFALSWYSRPHRPGSWLFAVPNRTADPIAPLQRPGVPQLDEESTVGLGETDVRSADVVVRIADEDHRPWIQLVGSEKLEK